MRYVHSLRCTVAVQAAASERALFLRRTYAHLAGAILAFAVLEALLLQRFSQAVALTFRPGMLDGPLLVLLAFCGVSWLARTWARAETSRAAQYLGLAFYVVALAVLALPVLALMPSSGRLIATAGIFTLALFSGLTLAAIVLREDCSLGTQLWCVGSMLALGLVIAALFVGATTGTWVAFTLTALMAGLILYETEHVLLYHRTEQYVSAALLLLTSVALLFFNVVQLLMLVTAERD